jgi:hypothetical protein
VKTASTITSECLRVRSDTRETASTSSAFVMLPLTPTKPPGPRAAPFRSFERAAEWPEDRPRPRRETDDYSFSLSAFLCAARKASPSVSLSLPADSR